MAEIFFAGIAGLHRLITGADAPTAFKASTLRNCHVQLVVTPIGPRLPKFQGYHSSLLIDRVEYSFSGRGLSKAEGPMSHGPFRRRSSDSSFIDFGWHLIDIPAFESAVKKHFAPGTYDLLRKNCNSFSDTALQLITGKRLDEKYRRLEALGHKVDKKVSFVQRATAGAYAPNPRAGGFDPCLAARSCHREVSAAADGPARVPLCC